jgi:hypothetical protein
MAAEPKWPEHVASGSMEPKDVVRRFLDHGMTNGQWNMDVIDECFDDRYYSHTWKGDLAHTGARQGRFFGAFETLEPAG